jgi:hypothetical protein
MTSTPPLSPATEHKRDINLFSQSYDILPPSPALTAYHSPQLSPTYVYRPASPSSSTQLSQFPRLPPTSCASTASSRASSPHRRRPSEAWTSLASPTRTTHRRTPSLFDFFTSPQNPEDESMRPTRYTSRASNRDSTASTASFGAAVSSKLGWLKTLGSSQPGSPRSETNEHDIEEEDDEDPLLALLDNRPEGPEATAALLETLAHAYRSQAAALRNLKSANVQQNRTINEIKAREDELNEKVEELQKDVEKQDDAAVCQCGGRDALPDFASDSGFESEDGRSRLSEDFTQKALPIMETNSKEVWTRDGPVNVQTENVLLRQRIVELESVVDSCLTLLR